MGLSLFPVPGNIVITIIAAGSDRLLAVENAVLERDHHIVQLAEKRHQFRNTQLLGVGADRTAGDAVVTGSRVGLTDKIHLEGGGVLPLFFRRVPFDIPGDAFLFSALPFSVFRSVLPKYHFIW